MQISAETFFAEALKTIERLRSEQMDNIKEAAGIMAGSILDDGIIHIFGSGHSKAFGMELSHRAGGLAPMNAISLDDLALKADNPISYEELRKPETERQPENGLKVLAIHNIKPEDAFILVSNSGRNGAIIEIALEVKRRGMPVIAVTSLEHSSRTTSRHPSGKKLYEIADVVIDNCGPYGDALLPVEGMDMQVCSISSISNAFIAQSMAAEVIKHLLEQGVQPPVFISQNVDGADEFNERLRVKYEDRVYF
ncbi:MAG: SIS domain-containing protein [Halanaerobium sp.]|nr:SIS domain-containing protein [Halanaerobium sp.]